MADQPCRRGSWCSRSASSHRLPFRPARGRRAPPLGPPPRAPAYDAGVHLRPRLGPANRPSAARVRGRRAMAENRAVLPPDGGQAAADDTRHAPTTAPHHAAPAAAALAAHARVTCAHMKIPSASSEGVYTIDVWSLEWFINIDCIHGT